MISSFQAWLLFDYAEYDLSSIINFYKYTAMRMPHVIKKSCIYQILCGVKYLHDSWIMHRDLVRLHPSALLFINHIVNVVVVFLLLLQKPDNIMVMGEGPQRGCIKIGDMGMARIFYSPNGPFCNMDNVVVTSWYRCPELLLGVQHYTEAIDVWSIGAIFGEILTSTAIFQASPDTETVRSPYQRKQLAKIFEILGYLTLTSWPDLKYCPDYVRMLVELNRFE